MDLQMSVFLLLALFKTGQSLDCYECFSVTGSCEDQKVQTCPELHSCFSSTVVTQLGNSNTTTAKYKGCSPYGCLTGFKNFMSADVSYVCCDTDLCNAKDTQVPSVEPNGNTCYSCYGQNCSKTACSGSEDHCVTITGNFGGQSFTTKACASKAACDASSSLYPGQSISCCSGNLCNSAKSFTLSSLFLCCSLMSFIMML